MSFRDHLEGFLAHTEHVRNLLARGEDGYQQEFTALKTQSQRYKTEKTYSTNAGEFETNIRKNRYKDILPFDYTRVQLSEAEGVPGSDYINASYVKGYSGDNTYIASQGPLPQTVHDFWRLIWESKATIIVMSCNEYEMGKHKCERYWVDEGETKEFNDISISMISQRRVHNDFLIRTLKVKKTTEERVLNQFHYTAWPDHGVPNSVLPIIEMVKLIRDYQPEDDVPLLIHCSAGCGRTGTICVIDYVFNQLKKEAITADFSLYDIVQEMRRQRPAMVQARDQYELVHRAVASMFNKHLQDKFEDFSAVYENVHLKPPQTDNPRMPPGTGPVKPQSSPNQQRKRHSDNHSYVNAKPGQIDGAELVRVPTIPKGAGRHSIDTTDLDVPVYANLQEDLESELSKDDLETSPILSAKNRKSFKANLSVFDDLEKELNIVPTSPTDKGFPSSKPAPKAKPVVSAKPSNANGPLERKSPPGSGGGGKPPPPIKPGLGNIIGERPVPRQRKNLKAKTPLQLSDSKTDGSVSPQANPTRNIVADIERALASGPRQLNSHSSPPSRQSSVIQRRSGPFLDESSALVSKEPVQRSTSNSIHPSDKSKFTRELNTALLGPGKPPRDFINKDTRENNRRNSQKRPTAAPPQPPPGGAKPTPPPQKDKPRAPRHEYEPVDLQPPPKKETGNDDSDNPHRLLIQIKPHQKKNLRRFSGDDMVKDQHPMYAQSSLSVRKRPPLITARSEDVRGSDIDSREPITLPRQPSVEYAYAAQPQAGRVEAMLKEKEANRALITGKPRTYASPYSEVDLKSPDGADDNGDSESSKFKIGKETTPPPKPGRSKLPSEGMSSSAYEPIALATSGKVDERDDVFSGASGMDEGMYGQYNDVTYLGNHSSSNKAPPDTAPRTAEHTRTESNITTASISSQWSFTDDEFTDGEDGGPPPALPQRTPASYELVDDQESSKDHEPSSTSKLKDFLNRGKNDLKNKTEGLKAKTGELKQNIKGKGFFGKIGDAVRKPDTSTSLGGQAPPSGPPPRAPPPQINQAEIIEKTLRTLDKQPDEPVIYNNHDISFPNRVPKPKPPRQPPQAWSDRAAGQTSLVQL